MELTNNHREALLNELEKAQEDKGLQTTCMKKEADLSQWFEIGAWLADNRIAAIRKAIKDNEIDY